MEPAETIIFFDISKMSFRLDGADLAVQNAFLTLDVCMRFFFQFFPSLIDLHHFIFIGIFLGVILIQAFRFVLTAAAVSVWDG